MLQLGVTKEAPIRVLVTGASGHIGYHIARELVSAGYKVRAFVRPTSFCEHLRKLPVEIFQGNVLRKDDLHKAVKGVDAVFHAAALYKLSDETEGDLIIKTAVEGTKNLYAAAKKSGINKIVYTSSVAAVGSSRDKNRIMNEENFAGKTTHSNSYAIAKIESEKMALKLAEEYNIFTVICNPSTVIGKEDYKPTPSNRSILKCVGFNFFYVEGGQSFVDVEDVARGHLTAFLKGRNLERYILSGENTEIKDMIIRIRDILGVKGPLLKLNKSLLRVPALLDETIAKMRKKEPFLTAKRVKSGIGKYSFYDHSKAGRELGYAPKGLAETLPGTLRWLMEKHG